MADRELRRMKRLELIEIICALQKRDHGFSSICGEERGEPSWEGIESLRFSEGDAVRLASEAEAERQRLHYRRRYRRTIRNTVYALLVVAAVSVLLATLFLPVVRVSGSSMEPTLENQDILLLFKSHRVDHGQVVGFYYQNQLLLKRVIAGPGDIIEIESDGTVCVNGEELEEPYVHEKSLGETDREYPYQIPEGRYFVMGDNRVTSLDSRSSTIGCIGKDQIVGKVVFRIWPLRK